MTRLDWDLSGITGLSGKVDRPLKPGLLVVPKEIVIEGDILLWGLAGRPVQPPSDLLERFLALSTPNDEVNSILRFAQRFGVFGFCEHDLPACHNWLPGGKAFGVKPCWPPKCERNGVPYYYENLERWRSLARGAQALLNVAAAVHAGKTGRSEDWVAADPARGSPSKPTEARERLVWRVGDWLKIGRVEVGFGHDFEIALQFGAPFGLFGALAVRLMLAIARSEGLAVCSSCRRSFIPKRRPDQNRLSFCQECGRKAAVRLAARRCREKKRIEKNAKTRKR